MGLWDSIVGGEEEKTETEEEHSDDVGKKVTNPKSTNPFTVSLSFMPLRLSANKRNSVDLIVKVTNVSEENHLLSVDAALPKNAMIGFSETCINKAVEKRVGQLPSGKSVELPLRIFANSQTKEGTYPIEVAAYSHYIGYDKVLSFAKKNTSLRVV